MCACLVWCLCVSKRVRSIAAPLPLGWGEAVFDGRTPSVCLVCEERGRVLSWLVVEVNRVSLLAWGEVGSSGAVLDPGHLW